PVAGTASRPVATTAAAGTETTAPPAAAAPSPLMPGLEVTVDQAERIDAYFSSLEDKDAFELLEVTRAADKRAIKRAYFKLSKEFHPDRFFGQNIGPYKERLSRIFQSVKAAFELLSDDTRRAAYEQSTDQR
ncbi:MAG TPA: DnaJ domain-containing protein, partial [Polyangia bacterium]|nr:DnaJ domain-containing protein [Polyangia bacterium]